MCERIVSFVGQLMLQNLDNQMWHMQHLIVQRGFDVGLN